MKNINRNPKLKLARRMMSNIERTLHVSPFQSMAWNNLKRGNHFKVMKQFLRGKKHA